MSQDQSMAIKAEAFNLFKVRLFRIPLVFKSGIHFDFFFTDQGHKQNEMQWPARVSGACIMSIFQDTQHWTEWGGFNAQVFVANKDRPDDITIILLSNQQKLLRFLTEFKVEKVDKGMDSVVS